MWTGEAEQTWWHREAQRLDEVDLGLADDADSVLLKIDITFASCTSSA